MALSVKKRLHFPSCQSIVWSKTVSQLKFFFQKFYHLVWSCSSKMEWLKKLYRDCKEKNSICFIDDINIVPITLFMIILTIYVQDLFEFSSVWEWWDNLDPLLRSQKDSNNSIGGLIVSIGGPITARCR